MASSRKSCCSYRRFQIGVKRGFDILAATITLIILSPLGLLVALAIKLSSRGQVFSSQRVHSYNNRIIRILKFRTSTDVAGSQLMWLGRAVRSTGLDELPMFLNVFLGDMAIVGPCSYASAPSLSDDDKLALSRNNDLRPGLTGWAQLRRSRTKHRAQRVNRREIEDDLFYIANWSLLFDFKIILMTLFSKRSYVLDVQE
jgi:lipopolysaccharide/colanic/teichoic acid biosynthesis glycosyltransferase